MEAEQGGVTDPERKVNPSEMNGHALWNRKLRGGGQRGPKFKADLNVHQSHLEDSPKPQSF